MSLLFSFYTFVYFVCTKINQTHDRRKELSHNHFRSLTKGFHSSSLHLFPAGLVFLDRLKVHGEHGRHNTTTTTVNFLSLVTPLASRFSLSLSLFVCTCASAEASTPFTETPPSPPPSDTQLLVVGEGLCPLLQEQNFKKRTWQEGVAYRKGLERETGRAGRQALAGRATRQAGRPHEVRGDATHAGLPHARETRPILKHTQPGWRRVASQCQFTPRCRLSHVPNVATLALLDHSHSHTRTGIRTHTNQTCRC